MRVAGIDPDTKAITIVIFSERAPDLWRAEVKGRRAEDRIQQLYALLSDLLLGVDWAYIETPVMGVNAKALRDQAQVVGMLRYHLWMSGISHSLVDNGTWKKAVLGNGHASKEEIAAYAQRVLGIDKGHPQDVYDAACIAHYGRQQHTPS